MMDFAAQIAYSTTETLDFTYKCALKFKDVEGVYVECGVAAGAQIIAMANAAPNKKIYAFDSFEGIPLPSNRDNQMPGIRKLKKKERESLPNPGEQELKSSGATVVSLEDFHDNLLRSRVNVSNIFPIKGWFEQTLPMEIEPIAILRLDGDLYNSTLVCLKHLFPKVVNGGVVIIDDWKLKGCREACKEYFESIAYYPNYRTVSNIVYFYK